jgi:protein-tyrosine phosphatase
MHSALRLDDAMRTVLFLCTGNYYRSRFAESLFNHLSAAEGHPLRAESRGLALTPRNVGPISRHALEFLGRLRVAPSDPHRMPLAVTEADLSRAAHVVAVKEAEHRPLLDRDFPAWTSRVEFWQVHDVDCAGPEVALIELEGHVRRLFTRLTRTGE